MVSAPAMNMNMQGTQRVPPGSEATVPPRRPNNYPNPHSTTSLQNQPVNGTAPGFGASRGLFGFIGNTLNYIGKHPLQFALSTGMAMACSFAVKAGIVALGVGLGPLGLAVAGAMATSLIMNVGRKLWNGEGISLSDLTGKALFSGAIAGVLGGIFGGFFADKLESLGDTLDPDLQPNDTTVVSEHNIDACETQAVTFATDCSMNPTDEYIYSISSWEEMKAYIDAQGETYQTIDMAQTTTLGEMVRSDADWFILIDEYGNAVEAMHHDGVVEMEQIIDAKEAAAGVEEHTFVNFTNSPYIQASITPISYEEGSLLAESYELLTGEEAAVVGYTVDMNSGLLYDKETFDAVMSHEIEHAVQLEEINTYDELEAFMTSADKNIELGADLGVYEDGNYGGALRFLTQITIDIDNMHERLEYALALDDPEEMRKVLAPVEGMLGTETIEKLVEGGDSFREKIIEEVKDLNTMDMESPNDPHPSPRTRILETMKHAAADPDLDKAAFLADMQECQDMIDGCDNLDFTIDLKSEWAKAQANHTMAELGLGNGSLLSSEHSHAASHNHGHAHSHDHSHNHDTATVETAQAEVGTETGPIEGKSSSFWRNMVTHSQIAVATRPRG